MHPVLLTFVLSQTGCGVGGGAAGCGQEGSQGKFNDRALLGFVAVTRKGLSHTIARVKGPARQGEKTN